MKAPSSQHHFESRDLFEPRFQLSYKCYKNHLFVNVWQEFDFVMRSMVRLPSIQI